MIDMKKRFVLLNIVCVSVASSALAGVGTVISPNDPVFSGSGRCDVNAEIPGIGYVTEIDYTTVYHRPGDFWFAYINLTTNENYPSGASIAFAAPVRIAEISDSELAFESTKKYPSTFFQHRSRVANVPIYIRLDKAADGSIRSGTLSASTTTSFPLTHCYGSWR